MTVEGVIYERGEWLDPGRQSAKDQLPPWLQYPGAGGGWGRPRDGFPSHGGVILDRREVFLAEQDRMRKNKITRFVLLIEDEDNNINVEPQYEAEARRAEESKTAQLEELHVLDYQGETAELEDVNETRLGDELQAVLEATGNINLNGEPQHEMEARTEEENKRIQLAESSKKHPGSALQADIPKRAKTEDEITTESSAAIHPTEMEQGTKSPRKTRDKGDSRDVDHTSTWQGEE